ncbi:hypothetical protein PCI56_01095 [Plesiomonas shigelloides subsp. oncorhynchi]|nr:hypothetical protein [Plesiomonas shigelloides]
MVAIPISCLLVDGIIINTDNSLSLIGFYDFLNLYRAVLCFDRVALGDGDFLVTDEEFLIKIQ